MADRAEHHENKRTTDSNTWWEESLNRRQAGVRLAGLGVGAVALVSAAGLIGCGGSDEEFSEEDMANAKDALEVQKSEGWNVGADKKMMTVRNASPTDSKGSLDGWQSYKDPAKLRAAWEPTNGALKPYISAELINSLNQPTLKSSIQPVHSSSMDEAYSRGLGMKELLKGSKDVASTAIIVDLPGPEAVAYAAALSDYADVVTTFDNWPHPNGVVPSQETLGALLYYAQEVEENKAKREKKAPMLLVADSNRLTPYQDAGDSFDNRYLATLPTAANLKSLGVKNVLYAVPDNKRTMELDDLNEDFVAYRNDSINITMMPLTDFSPPSAEAIAEHGQVKEGSTTTHRTYYYGGHPYFSPFFFAYYPMMFSPMRSYNYSSMRSPSTLTRPNYTPTTRPTMFSSRTVGGASGVGKQKPSGFGRVSTRTVNGRTTYSSSSSSGGRSGSFGRSSGRGVSG